MAAYQPAVREPARVANAVTVSKPTHHVRPGVTAVPPGAAADLPTTVGALRAGRRGRVAVAPPCGAATLQVGEPMDLMLEPVAMVHAGVPAESVEQEVARTGRVRAVAAAATPVPAG